jgi:hypothetical protein
VDEARTKKLRQILKRLGEAINASVADSDDVHECLAELHADGWDAVMLLEASLVCREDPHPETSPEPVRIHVDTTLREAEYRLGQNDVRLLSSLGISPSRHRSRPQRPRPSPDPTPPAGDDG